MGWEPLLESGGTGLNPGPTTDQPGELDKVLNLANPQSGPV